MYLVVLAAQFVLVRKAACNYGTRFVTTVLARKTGKEAPTTKPGAQKPKADGDASRKGNLRTLRLGEAGFGDSERSEATLGHPFISVPGVIAGQVHMLPAERGDMLK